MASAPVARGAAKVVLLGVIATGVIAAAAAFLLLRPREAPTGAPPSAPAQPTAFVGSVRAPLFEAANPASALPPGGALPIGAEVKLERPLPPPAPPDGGAEDYVRIVAPVAAFVRAADLVSEAPDFHQLFTAAKGALGNGEVQEAEAHALKANALRGKEREPLLLLAGLYDAQSRPDDARRIASLLAELGPPPPKPAAKAEPRQGPLPAPGQRWYVSATQLRIRNKPASTGAVLAEAPINTEVEILSVDGDWAQLKWTPPESAQAEFALNTQSAQGQALSPVVGHAAHAFLARARLTSEQALQQAEAAASRGDPVETARMLARAALIDPYDTALQRRLAAAAAEVGEYQTAAVAAMAASELAAGGETPSVSLSLVAGCRGQRSRAQFIDDVTAASREAPADACVETFIQPECKPCDCGSGYYEEFERPQEIANRRAQLEEEGKTEEEIEAAIAAEFPEPERQPDPMVEWQQQEDARVMKRAAALERFTDGPWVKLEVSGPARPTPGQRVIVYQFVATEQLEPHVDSDGADPQTCASRTAEVVAIDTVPVPARGKTVTLWIKVPEYESTYGVEFGQRAEEVKERLQEAYSRCGSGEPPLSVTGTPDGPTGCESCQCT